MHNEWAGTLIEDAEGFHFSYEMNYLNKPKPEAISLTMPIRKTAYFSHLLFPFFDGLIPEGWLLDLTEKNWKINTNDRMSILLVACQDCTGAVSVIPFREVDND